jgi:MFS family permease
MLAGFTFLALRILDLGGQASDVALSAGISALAEIPAMALVPRVAARTGIRSVLVAGILLYGLTMASWAFLADPGLIVASRLVSGVAFAGMTIGAVMTIAALLPPELQATGQGLYQTVGFGLAAIVANALGGVVYASGGALPLFLGCAVLAVIGALVAWRSIPAGAAAGRLGSRP